MESRLLSSSTLVGTSVENATGDNLGQIEDLMINWKEGKVAYAVLSFGGFLGIGDKYFAVPLESFKTSPDPDRNVLVLNESKERLKNSPGFDKDHWPSTADNVFTEKVYKHYNVL
ncbi:PRC-barrel domain-containing protein [Brumimicrobium mesophilum]|uniref:PRC-barrel domain-containing protein n=1 Tax=Brumimicrobium mesophilum TaxID=392717 RepID=UPI000D14467D|nr:PRC-barrel domain-containing protein [Brumimicrobium mesophilum]